VDMLFLVVIAALLVITLALIFGCATLERKN
jgi:hypothetical protein